MLVTSELQCLTNKHEAFLPLNSGSVILTGRKQVIGIQLYENNSKHDVHV